MAQDTGTQDFVRTHKAGRATVILLSPLLLLMDKRGFLSLTLQDNHFTFNTHITSNIKSNHIKSLSAKQGSVATAAGVSKERERSHRNSNCTYICNLFRTCFPR